MALDLSRKHFNDSDELCEYISKETGGVCLLSFSLGKDSVAAWLKCRRFFKVIPFHLEVVPGLRFVKEALTYYEDFFQTKIHVYPHPATYDMLNNEVFQTPRRAAVLPQLAFMRELTVDDCKKDVRKKHKADEAWSAISQRASDSVIRAKAIEKHGPLNYTDKYFFPVYDWKTSHMVDAFRESGVKLPPDYFMFNRSFDSVRYRFLEPLQRFYPDDYERILFWFPMAKVELYRRQFAKEPVE